MTFGGLQDRLAAHFRASATGFVSESPAGIATDSFFLGIVVGKQGFYDSNYIRPFGIIGRLARTMRVTRLLKKHQAYNHPRTCFETAPHNSKRRPGVKAVALPKSGRPPP